MDIINVDMRNDLYNNQGIPCSLKDAINDSIASYLKRHVDFLEEKKMEFENRFIFDIDDTSKGYISE